MGKGQKKGQSTLEYVLLVVAVVVVLLALLSGTDSPFKAAVTSTMNSGLSGMATYAERLKGNALNP